MGIHSSAFDTHFPYILYHLIELNRICLSAELRDLAVRGALAGALLAGPPGAPHHPLHPPLHTHRPHRCNQ